MIAGMHVTCRNFAKGLVAAAGLSAVVACAAMDVTFDGENTLLSICVGAALPRFRAQAEMGGEGSCKVRVGCGTAGGGNCENGVARWIYGCENGESSLFAVVKMEKI